ncbi:MAG: FecR domain-containing protein [Tannerellaceae bacterium]|jgi:ferric-dicitrate binding protein FerR (iron transport regulator)|nr:FecR domain-containing protein [Tannerellaceae bacterium]
MYRLIERYFEGEITSDEKKLLFSQIEKDSELKKEFISVQNLFAVSSLLPAEDDETKAWAKLKQFRKRRQARTFTNTFKRLTGYVAAVSITLLATWFVMKETPSHIDESLVAYEEFITPPSQRAMVKLSDGTIVWLNARSSLRYPNIFTKGERRVELNGEAFFDVAHNEELPFVVSTEKLNIKALGTEFNVHAYSGKHEFNTSLISGSVKIYNKGEEDNAILLSPNEYVELVNNQLVKRAIDNMDFLLWKEGIYAFDDVAFADIVNKLELYYDVSIQVANKRLDSYKFTGKFRQRDGVENVLRTLQKVCYFRFVKDEENNVITIR